MFETSGEDLLVVEEPEHCEEDDEHCNPTCYTVEEVTQEKRLYYDQSNCIRCLLREKASKGDLGQEESYGSGERIEITGSNKTCDCRVDSEGYYRIGMELLKHVEDSDYAVWEVEYDRCREEFEESHPNWRFEGTVDAEMGGCSYMR